MPEALPPLVYLLLFSIFLLAHCDLGDGPFRAEMMSNRCQANCMEKEEWTCSPFKMIDSMAPHSSSGSSWPTLLSPSQGDLVSPAVPFLPSWPPGGSACVVWANEFWVMELGSPLSSHQAYKGQRKAKGRTQDRHLLTKGRRPHLLGEIIHVTCAEWLSDSQKALSLEQIHVVSGGKFIIQDTLLCRLQHAYPLGEVALGENSTCPWSICFIMLGDRKPFLENQRFCLMANAKVG